MQSDWVDNFPRVHVWIVNSNLEVRNCNFVEKLTSILKGLSWGHVYRTLELALVRVPFSCGYVECARYRLSHSSSTKCRKKHLWKLHTQTPNWIVLIALEDLTQIRQASLWTVQKPWRLRKWLLNSSSSAPKFLVFYEYGKGKDLSKVSPFVTNKSCRFHVETILELLRGRSNL